MPKTAFSCYFELQLDISDFGKSRKEHFKKCNQQLLSQLLELNREGKQLHPDYTNEALISNIIKKSKSSNSISDLTWEDFSGKAPSDGFIWEHCSSSTADGRLGVMRLVPSSQHTGSSEYWRIIHPDYGARGGYHEWAMPAGAPSGTHLPLDPEINIGEITLEQLPEYFKTVVAANQYDKFEQLLAHAKSLKLTPEQFHEIFTQQYKMGKTQRPTTLLHIATANGYPKLIKAILSAGVDVHGQLRAVNASGATPVHIAAGSNRGKILDFYIAQGADRNAKNNSGQTPFNIAMERRSLSCLRVIGMSGIRHPASAIGSHQSVDDVELKLSLPVATPTGGRLSTSRATSPVEILSQKALSESATHVPPDRRDPYFVYSKPILTKPQNAVQTAVTHITAPAAAAAPLPVAMKPPLPAPQMSPPPLKTTPAAQTPIQRHGLFSSTTTTHTKLASEASQHKGLESFKAEMRSQAEQRAQQQQAQLRALQRSQLLALQSGQLQAQKRAQIQALQRTQIQSLQQRIGSQVPLRGQPKVPLRSQSAPVQQRTSQRIPPQIAQRPVQQAAQQATQRAAQQAAQRAAQQAAQRAAQQAAQRAAQQAAQRAAQQAAQRAAQQAAQRAAQQAAQRAAQQATQRAAQQATQRAAQQTASQRGVGRR